MTETTDKALCGHRYVLGDVEYECERPPHPVDGYGPKYRHVSGIDAELAEAPADAQPGRDYQAEPAAEGSEAAPVPA